MKSKFEFWCDLPNEMRTECIKRMDFKTRMRLRAASKQDKLLVESAPKYYFKLVDVILGVNNRCAKVYCSLTSEKDYEVKLKESRRSPTFPDKAHQLFIQILKFSNAEKLLLDLDDNDISNFLINTDFAPFRFEIIELNTKKFEIVDFLLENNNFVKEIILKDRFRKRSIMLEFADFPAVINADRVILHNVKNPEIAWRLINNWLEFDSLKTGKCLEVMTAFVKTSDAIAAKFENRKINPYASIESFLVTTNNPTKAIQIDQLRDHETIKFVVTDIDPIC